MPNVPHFTHHLENLDAHRKGDLWQVVPPSTSQGQADALLRRDEQLQRRSNLRELVRDGEHVGSVTREAVTISQGTLREGQKGGLIRVSLFHLNLWLTQRALRSKLILQLDSLEFVPEGIRANLKAHELPGA